MTSHPSARPWPRLLVAIALLPLCGACEVEVLEPPEQLQRCLDKRFEGSGIPQRCLEDYVTLISPLLVHAGQVYDYHPAYDLTVNEACEVLVKAVDEEIAHSAASVPPKEPDEAWTEICAKALAYVKSGVVDAGGTARRAADDQSPLRIEGAYPCGDTGDGKVLCGAETTFPPGPFTVMGMVTHGTIPLADPERSFQYAFVFDADGNPANNYQASPQYPNDFFDNTDRWYVASYTPARGWRLEVSTAVGGAIASVPTAARVVIAGSGMLLLAPASEFGVPCAGYRMTTFSHRGDYGIPPPYVWSADTEPTVDQPLETACTVQPPM